MKIITRKEGYALVLFAVLAVIWGLLVNPYLQSSSWFFNLNPIFAYVLYNFGTYFLVTLIFGVPISFVIRRSFKVNWKDLFVSGLVTFLLFSNVFDMWQGPLAWNLQGTLLIIPNVANLEKPAVDYMYGWIWQSLGLAHWFTYYFVYVVVPALTLLMAAIIFGQKEFFKIIKKIT
jgi:hypothetical protein